MALRFQYSVVGVFRYRRLVGAQVSIASSMFQRALAGSRSHSPGTSMAENARGEGRGRDLKRMGLIRIVLVLAHNFAFVQHSTLDFTRCILLVLVNPGSFGGGRESQITFRAFSRACLAPNGRQKGVKIACLGLASAD